MNTLIILAHPSLTEHSTANKVIVEQLQQANSVKINNLYEHYPTFDIDVKKEQQLLVEADTIVFQFPFYWYSVPSLLKHWLDTVFLYGFAFGGAGGKLQGKQMLVSTTIGGDKQSYQSGGHNHFTVTELLKPLKQTANFTSMKFLEPVVSYDMQYMPEVIENKNEIVLRAKEHANKLLNYIDNQQRVA